MPMNTFSRLFLVFCLVLSSNFASSLASNIPAGVATNFTASANEGFEVGQILFGDVHTNYLIDLSVSAHYDTPNNTLVEFYICLSPIVPTSRADCVDVSLVSHGGQLALSDFFTKNVNLSGYYVSGYANYSGPLDNETAAEVHYTVQPQWSSASCLFDQQKAPFTESSWDFYTMPLYHAKACFKHVPVNFEAEIVEGTLKSMRQLNEFYSFFDIVRNSGHPWDLSVILDEELDKIDLAYREGEYKSDYDFQVAIHSLYARLFDAHTLYYLGYGYSDIFVVFPLDLGSRLKVSDNTQEIYVKGDLKDWIEDVDLVYAEMFPGVVTEDYVGYEIVSIEGKPVLEFLLALSDDIGTYKDPAVRVNRLIDNEWMIFSAGSRKLPEREEWTIEFKNTADGSIVQETFPFMAISLDNTKSVEEFQSTLVPESSVAAGAARRTPFSTEAHDGGNGQFLSNSIHAANNPEAVFHGRVPVLGKQQILSKVNSMRKEEEISPLPPHLSESYDEQAAQSSFSRLTNDCEELPTWISPSTSTMIMGLRTFGPDSLKSFRQCFQSILNAANDRNYEKFLIDVTGNGGGYIALMYEMLAVLVKDFDLNPLEPYDMRLGATSETMASIGISDLYDMDSFLKLEILKNASASYVPNPVVPSSVEVGDCTYGTDSWFDSGRTRIIHLPESSPASDSIPTTTNRLTTRWYPNIYEGSGFENSGHYFDKIIILTDGSCGSSCSYFLTKMMLYDKAYVVTYGGVKGYDRSGASGFAATASGSAEMHPDTSSFCGGMVEGWSYFVSAMKIYGSHRIVLDDVPTTAYTRFNMWESYPGNSQMPREFRYIGGKHHIWSWEFSKGDSEDPNTGIYPLTLPLFESVPSAAPGENTLHEDYDGWGRTCEKSEDGSEKGSSNATLYAIIGFVACILVLLFFFIFLGCVLWCVAAWRRHSIFSAASRPMSSMLPSLKTAQAASPDGRYTELQEDEDQILFERDDNDDDEVRVVDIEMQVEEVDVNEDIIQSVIEDVEEDVEEDTESAEQQNDVNRDDADNDGSAAA